MEVTFPVHDSWRQFYEEFGLSLTSSVSHDGWIECNCPVHPEHDKNKKGAVNIWSGNYKCWVSSCQLAYRETLGYNLDSAVLTPREFLIVAHKYSVEQATQIVTEYIQDIDPKKLDTSTFDKLYRPNKELIKFAEEAQKAITPDLHIVQEYLRSRNLTYDTLCYFKCGYVPSDGTTPEYLFIPYYYRGFVAGARCRTVDNRKCTVAHSYSCLFNIDNATNSGSKTVIIVEGETDCLYLTQLLTANNINIPVVATPGSLFKKEWKRDLQQFTRIIIIPQNDDAADGLVRAAYKHIKKELITVIELPWKPLTYGKDIVDFCSQHDVQILVDLIGAEEVKYKKRVMSGQDFVEESNIEIPYIVPGLIEQNTKVLIVGEPKTYKTWIAFQLVNSVVNCKPFLGVEQWTPTIPGRRALLVEEEGSSHRMGARLQLVTKGEGLDRITVIHRQNILIDNPPEFLRLVDDIRLAKPDVLIFDPYVLIHTQDENSATGTAIVMTAFNKLLTLFPTMAIVIIHHSSKASPKSPRGSGALYGSVDELISVTRQESGIQLDLRGRDLIEGQTDKLSLFFNGETHCHQPANQIIVEDTEVRRATADLRDKLIVFLSKEKQATKQDIYNACKMLATQPTVSKVLDALESEGLITVEGAGNRFSPKICTWIGGNKTNDAAS